MLFSQVYEYFNSERNVYLDIFDISERWRWLWGHVESHLFAVKNADVSNKLKLLYETINIWNDMTPLFIIS